MARQPEYSITRTPRFEEDLERVQARHIPRGLRGRLRRRKFVGFIESALLDIGHDPRRHKEQPWPCEPIVGCELRKARLIYNPFRDRARYVRIPYILHVGTKVVFPLCVYTHAEFELVIPDADLSGVLDALANEYFRTEQMPAALRKIAGEEEEP